jgi:hypothetical protein
MFGMIPPQPDPEPEPTPTFGSVEEFVEQTELKAAISWQLLSMGIRDAEVELVDVPLLHDAEGQPVIGKSLGTLVVLTRPNGFTTMRIAQIHNGRLRLGDGGV